MSSSREPWDLGKSFKSRGLGFLGYEGHRCPHRPQLSGT